MKKVYLIFNPVLQRDLAQAEDFGDIIHCLKPEERELAQGMILNRLRSTLRDFDENDYILWAGGDWTILVLVGVVLKEIGLRRFDLLVWKKFPGQQRGNYIPKRVNL